MKFDDGLFCKKLVIIIAQGKITKNNSDPFLFGDRITTTVAINNWFINTFHDILNVLLTKIIFGVTTTKDQSVIVIKKVIGNKLLSIL